MNAPAQRHLDTDRETTPVMSGTHHGPDRQLDLAELITHFQQAGRHLSQTQRDELVAAFRRVWLRNRLPESFPTAAVRDVADHCDLATITALAGLGSEASARVDPQPVTAWEEPVAQQECPVAGWGLS